jgi:iron complex transport system ATP-binding protein
VIEARSLTVALAGRTVASDISLSVPTRGWLMLIGPNGAGKSTVLRALAGLVPHAGSVTLGGHARSSLRRRQVARTVAFVPQNPQLPGAMTVWEYVALGLTPHLGYLGRAGGDDERAVAAALDRLELKYFEGRRLATLSGGERQRAVLARALVQDAPILLLDEPTAALDVGRQQDVLDMVAELRRRQSLTVVGALHDLTLAGQYADELVLLDAGRIVTRGPAEQVLREPLLNRHYDARLRAGAPAGHGLVVTPLPPSAPT